ncbi:hypothetical protein KFL_001050300 [Klebsormidium nitens]|uniref:Uncharacterized protein n=1 Tax=Klebsormidium nitens TaxID=105231 RepID=A0A1Y1I0F9_KLENI|nr:hypothetical protein KFL_001050300 [Klebsormidium nitens]|eukprot:GAQ82267.1 hypothetical protein KFL_001050300 [Klebsormidium nitens]
MARYSKRCEGESARISSEILDERGMDSKKREDLESSCIYGYFEDDEGRWHIRFNFDTVNSLFERKTALMRAALARKRYFLTTEDLKRIEVIKNSRDRNRIQGPADNTEATAKVADAIKRWNQDSEGRKKLVIPLKHQYTQDSLSYDTLRGKDIATVEVFLQAAKTCNAPAVHIFLGMLQKFEERNVDLGDTEFRTSYSLSNIYKLHGYSGAYKRIEVEREELIPETALDGREWQKEDERFTRNEGMVEERWYHHAALVIWPHARHWEIACTNDPETVLKVFIREYYGPRSFNNRCFVEHLAARFGWRALAPAFIDWLVREFAGNEYARKDCFQVLLQISNTVSEEQTNTTKELSTKKDERELSASAGQSQGNGETLRDEQERLAVSGEALAAVVSAVCSKWSEGSYGLTRLIDLLSEDYFQQVLDRFGWTPWTPAIDCLIGPSLKSLHCWGFDGEALKSLVAHFVAHPRLYDLEKTLVPTLTELRAWLKERKEATPAWFMELCQGCLEALEKRCSEPPLGARDWAARVDCDCGCRHCRQLVDFCADPVETELLAFGGLGPEAKAHVIASIQR